MTTSDPVDTASVDWRRVANAIGFVVLVAVVFLFVASAVPQVVGSDESYVVRSDSMSPAIDAGSVVFVSETSPEAIDEGDVITFRESDGAGDDLVTHRVVDVTGQGDQREFRTKGDANDDADPGSVSRSQIVGVVQFHVPMIGYVSSFAQTRLGIVALVVVPALLLAVSELWDLYRETEANGEDSSGGVDEP